MVAGEDRDDPGPGTAHLDHHPTGAPVHVGAPHLSQVGPDQARPRPEAQETERPLLAGRVGWARASAR